VETGIGPTANLMLLSNGTLDTAPVPFPILAMTQSVISKKNKHK